MTASSLFRRLPTLMLAALLLIASPASPEPSVDPGKRYKTPELITDTVKGLRQCLKYCLLGIEIRIRYTGLTMEVYFVPRVEHHMVALHAMTSDRFPEEAYLEWAALVGALQKQLLDRMAQVVPPVLGLSPILESNGGPTRYGQYGHHQSTNFKEAEFMGHPVAILPALVDKNGDLTADTYTTGNTGGGGSGAGGGGIDGVGYSLTWAAWAKNCFQTPGNCAQAPAFPGAQVASAFDMGAVIQMVMAAVQASGVDFKFISGKLREIATAVADNASLGGGVKIDRLLCPNDVYYFFPYYLSGVDALFWRSGFPITDAAHTTTLLNPFSGDRVGRAGETWGHVYPRHGFLNNDHPGRVAPVIAYRGAQLLADPGVPLRPKLTTAYAHGDWQNLSPEPTAHCEANIADLPTPIDPGGGYAHNIWPVFQCPLSEIGFLVAFIPYRYCFY
ncbi:MAG: hypothetical protein WAW42_06890 [Candidatus Competibacteraceae bacterium]